MLDRPLDKKRIDGALRRARVVLVVGARQVGKTTLARSYVKPSSPNYFDLEDPTDLARLSEPMLALSDLKGLVVISEIQRAPDLFSVLRVLVDRDPLPARFLILGSASPEALRQASESLTGRIEVLDLDGLRPVDVGADALDRLWLRGTFPSSYAAASNDDSYRWREQYVRNLATRDLPEFGVGLPAASVQRFLALVAHVHGQLWNASRPAQALGISESTVRKYIDVLDDALLVRVLQPWHANISKRQVRTPKVYFRDPGLAHALFGVRDWASLLRSPLVGPSWEGWVIGSLLQAVDDSVEKYFWRTSGGAELDLLLQTGEQRVGVEIKRADAPRLTPSMRSALTDLQLDKLTVVYSGAREYRLADNVSVVPMQMLVNDPQASFLFNH